MSDDSIRKLLRVADELAGPTPSGPADLAERVRRAAHRRRTAAAAVLGLVAGVGVVAIGFLAWPGPPAEQGDVADGHAPQPDAAALRAEMAALQTEIDRREAVLAHVLLLEQARRQRVHVALLAGRGDPMDVIRCQTDRAACAMIRHAADLSHKLGRPDSAQAAYRRVIALFPDTPWAKVARQRTQRPGSS